MKQFVGGLCAAGVLGMAVASLFRLADVEVVEPKSDYVTHEYQIEVIAGDNYYGINRETESGVFFTEDLLREPVEVGDTVEAVFEADDLVEGLVAVYKK